MMRALWIAKTGLEAQQTNMDVITNNRRTSAPTDLSVSARCLKICCIKRCVSRARSRQNRPPSLRATGRHRRASGGDGAHSRPGRSDADQ